MIGLGLIGGSVLRALAAAGHRVLGYDADPATRATARTASAKVQKDHRWQVTASIGDTVRAADLVVIAVPLPAVGAVLDEINGHTGLVTDVTSVKGPIRNNVTARFVGGHPMAGRERSGFAASDGTLFDGCAWALCLEQETALDDWLTVAALVTRLGARVVPTTADEHDRAVAAVSHVPHLVASALAGVAGRDKLALTLGAGSFRDGTRVAATRAALVAAMCGGNAAAVRDALDALLTELTEARRLLDDDDPISALPGWLDEGGATRRAWPTRAGEPQAMAAEPDALRELGRAGGWVTAVAADRGSVTAVRPAAGQAGSGARPRAE